ncbi:unnamed protein product [Callosobruchus maculatus]|uniref:Uncharacterized protein n=1 Tax=Callosobruchus maculatus TaxID=64391 RepID=A0A653DBR0_CALMS|nr:unnamed protein product [Callosobruchus maculatus]
MDKGKAKPTRLRFSYKEELVLVKEFLNNDPVGKSKSLGGDTVTCAVNKWQEVSHKNFEAASSDASVHVYRERESRTSEV